MLAIGGGGRGSQRCDLCVCRFLCVSSDASVHSSHSQPPAVTPFRSNVFVCCFLRELCEESMTHSLSSASSLDSHAPSEGNSQSGPSQGARWEEQQKVLALEQLCGVFRVDLGHMRSLRLFFRSADQDATRSPAGLRRLRFTDTCLLLIVTAQTTR